MINKKYKILKIGNPLLRNISEDINFDTDNYTQTINILKETLNSYQNIFKIGRAIAAPQLGIFKNIIFMETDDLSIVMINPLITYRSKETFEVWDSCFCADTAFFGKTLRNCSINVEYYNENSEKIERFFNKDLSELFQHEIDHLKGILFTDRIIDNQIIMREEWEML